MNAFRIPFFIDPTPFGERVRPYNHRVYACYCCMYESYELSIFFLPFSFRNRPVHTVLEYSITHPPCIVYEERNPILETSNETRNTLFRMGSTQYTDETAYLCIYIHIDGTSQIVVRRRIWFLLLFFIHSFA